MFTLGPALRDPGYPPPSVVLQLPFDTVGSQVDQSTAHRVFSTSYAAGELASVNSNVAGPFGPNSAQMNPGFVKGSSTSSTYGGAFYTASNSWCDIGSGYAAIEVFVRINSADTASSRGGWVISCLSSGYAISSGDDSQDYAKGYYSLYMDSNGALRFHWGAPGSGAHQTISSGSSLLVDTWHYVRISISPTTMRMRVNGAIVAEATRTVPMSGFVNSSSNGFVIGGLWNQSSGPKFNFVGNIGGLRMSKNNPLDDNTVPSSAWPIPT